MQKQAFAIVRNGLIAALLITGLTGCAAFRASTSEVDVDEKRHLDNKFDYTDMRNVTEEVVDDILSSQYLQSKEKAPVMMIAGIMNRTSQTVDTKNLTDRMRTLMLQSRQVRFINETRREDLLKEQGYQASYVTPETQVQLGRQLGAKYMLSGSLTEMSRQSPRQARVSRTELSYYKLTVEITDLQSGEIVWITEKEFAREARRPLIGW